MLRNVFCKKSEAKLSFRALFEIPELLSGLYIGISINRLKNYNVSFKIAYNKKVYTKKRVNFYIEISGNVEIFGTNKIKRIDIEKIETIARKIICNDEEIEKIYVKKYTQKE